MSDIEDFLAAKTYAVAGASNRQHKYGNKVFRALLAAGRETYPLNPAQEEIEGHQDYRRPINAAAEVMRVTWFTQLTGVEEESPEQVRRELSVEGDQIVCPSGKRIAFGRLETPKLSELRQAVAALDVQPSLSTIREVVGNVRQLHADPASANAFFQVASQFNLLEMTGPSVTPERGVGIYEGDGLREADPRRRLRSYSIGCRHKCVTHRRQGCLPHAARRRRVRQ